MAEQSVSIIYVCEKCRRSTSKRPNAETPIDTDGEIWKPIPGYEGFYEASSAGRIRSIERRVPIKGRTTRLYPAKVLSLGVRRDHGYYQVSLCKENTSVRCYVHRLVCLTFHGEGAPGMEVAHNDGNRLNNRDENLRWATTRDNIHDKKLHGTWRPGDRSPVALLTWDQVDAIRSEPNS
jgi:hypothetical protein